tara:strand:- start:1824 stop:2192 length:369 start_codon:yes stop_codon:yes gene_type:complete
MRISKRQLRKIILEASRKKQVGDISHSGKYFDVVFRGKIRGGLGVNVLIHRPSGYKIPTSMYDYSAKKAKELVVELEKEFGDILANPELNLDVDSLYEILGFLKRWKYPASKYHKWPESKNY